MSGPSGLIRLIGLIGPIRPIPAKAQAMLITRPIIARRFGAPVAHGEEDQHDAL